MEFRLTSFILRMQSGGQVVDMESTKPNEKSSIILKSTPGSSSDSGSASKILSWIYDQLTTLAVAFREQLIEERVEIYARALTDIPQDRLNVAFQRALRELTFFPKVAELRSLAVSSSDDEKNVEANAAWDYVNDYLRKWGVDLLPLHSGGQVITPPPLDSRTDYALRRIGGLRALNQVDIDKLPFMRRDFCEAYTLAPVAELMALSLPPQFGEDKLQGNIKQLTEAKSMEHRTQQPGLRKDAPPVQRNGEWYAERRAELKRQADELLAKRKRDEPFELWFALGGGC